MNLEPFRYFASTWGGNYSDRAGWTMVRENVPRYVLAAVKDAR